MDKQTAVYLYRGLLLSNKKEEAIHIHNDLYESQILSEKRPHALWFHLNDILQKTNYRGQKQINGWHRQGEGKGVDFKDAQDNLRDNWNILYLNCGSGTRLCLSNFTKKKKSWRPDTSQFQNLLPPTIAPKGIKYYRSLKDPILLYVNYISKTGGSLLYETILQ